MKKNIFTKALSLILSMTLFLGCFTLTAFADEYPNTYKNTGDGAKDIVGVAATQIGYSELSSGYTKYGEAMGCSYTDWCCAFVVWCARQAGIGTNAIPSIASCSLMYSSINSKLISKSQSQGSNYVPKIGDLAFFENNGNKSDGPDHIGIVSSVSGSTMYIIEGNCSDKVKKMSYSLSSSEIIAFASPDYTQVASTGLIFTTTEAMNVRSSASTSGDIKGVLSKGSTIYVEQITADNWGLITYNGSEAWIYLKYSTFSSGKFVTSDIVNLRAGASLSGAIVDTIPKGTQLSVTKISNTNWGYVTYSGHSGWICLMPGADREAEVSWIMIDISEHNSVSSLNWTKLKAAGVSAAIIRIGGRYVNKQTIYDDELFYEHYKAAKAAGMHVGVYFFSYALTEAGAKEEAQFTIDTLKKYNCELDMPVFIDIEDYSESDGTDYSHSKAGKTVCTKIVNTFCTAIENAGYYPGIYCSKSFAEDLIEPSSFNGRAVWIAHYGVTQCGYTGNYDMWQYTRYGDISGSTGDIDLSLCYTDFPSLIEKLNTSSYSGHTAGEWTTVTKATCTARGKQQKVCTDCGIVLETQETEFANHTASVTCIKLLKTDIAAGDTLTETDIKALHKATDADYKTLMYESCWETQGGTKLTYCTVCKKVISAEYSYPSCKHTSTKTVIKTAATCKGNGIQNIQCTSCNKVISSSLINSKAHTEGKTVRTSCTSAGTVGTVCSVCGNTYKTVYKAAGQHTAGTWTTVTAVSLTQDGKYTTKCTVCGEAMTKTVSKPTLADASLDGKITAEDARLALRASVDIESLSDAAKCASDMDNDKKVTSADARLILRLSVGLEKSDELYKKYYS